MIVIISGKFVAKCHLRPVLKPNLRGQFISVINQLDAQNFCFTISLFHASTCFEHVCSKHVEAWNKLIVKQKFCASSWLITEINILRCTVSKTSNVGGQILRWRWGGNSRDTMVDSTKHGLISTGNKNYSHKNRLRQAFIIYTTL